MTSYECRYGTIRRKTPKPDFYGLPYKIKNDDGLILYCGQQAWPNVLCPDCKQHNVMWAEAGYVPGHRICPMCGSHFSMCPPNDDCAEWHLQRARFY